MKKTVEADVVIVGGGIAGLWLLNRLRQQNYTAILLESGSLGGGQTNKAQGIIHGGVKYALQGSITQATQSIAAMPDLWKQCLQGKGDVDLTRVPILSHHHYLWSTGTLASKLAGFFAGFALNNQSRALEKAAFPDVFQNPQFQGQVYSLDELVLDVHSLVRELAIPNHDAIFKIDPMEEDHVEVDEANNLISFKVQAAPLDLVEIKAQHYVFTAGNGNQWLLKKFKQPEVAMQQRPLQMVVMKHDLPYSIYAHCLGLSSVPRLTITTHRAEDGQLVWYLGGQIAEEGVKRSSEEQIQVVKKELRELFPWLDFSNAKFASFFVDRAERKQSDGKRPDSCSFADVGNATVAWPTKLALAPLLANQIVESLNRKEIKPRFADTRELRAWPMPALAKPVWDELL